MIDPPAIVSPEALDYLQRVGALPLVEAERASSTTIAPNEFRRMIRIDGVSYLEKRSRPSVDEPVPPTKDILAGLAGYQIPFAFVVDGHPGRVSFYLGTWSSPTREHVDPQVLDARRDIVGSLLRAVYPSIDAVHVESPHMGWPVAGMALGVPAGAPLDPLGGSSTIDRLVRSMTGASWAALVLAEPVGEQLVGKLRNRVINEMRVVTTEEDASGTPSPLSDQYVSLLRSALDDVGIGFALGAWRTAIYLMGDEVSYPRLASAWRAVFSGPGSRAEPVRVFDGEGAVALAEAWAMPDVVGAEGPSGFRHPYACQTLMNSAQLAGVVQLPRLEAPGFSIRLLCRFDVVPPPEAPPPLVALGVIEDGGQPTASRYSIPLDSLTRHVFVAGVTGSGKTNTIFHLLQEAHAADVPFLVIEPAKREYRSLLNDSSLGAGLRVFTAGEEMNSPLALNPFEVPAGATVSSHLDLLRAAFAASFAMWTPLPQVLERCLHEVYLDRGWDLTTNQNTRVAADGVDAGAFPTLTDLIAKVAEVVPRLGYEDRVTGDIRAALTSRLDGLRHGGKGAMFDVDRSTAINALLGGPCVIELEGLGDDGDKAFLAALLLIRLVEHRRATGSKRSLSHLLVIEEAHRLFADAATRSSEGAADSRSEAVATFANLLSEIRAYGQGVIIADQIPVRLLPDVMKNTNLKIAHRVVAADDRNAIAATMAMTEEQSTALVALQVGEAAVFGAGDDSPLLVQVPGVKDDLDAPISGERLAERARRKSREAHRMHALQCIPSVATCASA